jgi:succinate-semialdehyde dehydrogenase / glutarate-semialdehyde dehydrogenase
MKLHAIIKNQDLLVTKCYVNANWIDSEEKFPVYNPYDNSVIAQVPKVNEEIVQNAILAAHKSMINWRAISCYERSKFLAKWAELIRINREDLAKIITMEQGKTLKESDAEIDYALSFIDWHKEEIKRINGELVQTIKPEFTGIIEYHPIGVVAVITPWNFPMAMITRAVAPALAAGCSVVIKPAEDTPLIAFAIAKLASQAGIPDGVMNVITGDPVIIGKIFMDSDIIRKISFTGSTEVGKLLYAQSAKTVKSVSMELGGNAPFIVLDDADIDATINTLMLGKLRNTGQSCTSPNRILIAKSIYDEFCIKLSQEVAKIKVGNGFDPNVNNGPLINKDAIEKISKLLEDATNKGAKITVGGKFEGNLCHPTVIKDVKVEMDIFNNEIFGPVFSLMQFEDIESAIILANNTNYGLAAYLFTSDKMQGWKIASKLEYGMIGINTYEIAGAHIPFGGVKESGIGRESGRQGLMEYLEVKYINIL